MTQHGPAITYVMLSRVTSRDRLYILDGLRPENFKSVEGAAFADDATRAAHARMRARAYPLAAYIFVWTG